MTRTRSRSYAPRDEREIAHALEELRRYAYVWRHLIGSLPAIGDRAPRQGLGGSPPNPADPPAGCRFHPRCPLAMPRCGERNPPLVGAGPKRRVACFAVTPEAG